MKNKLSKYRSIAVIAGALIFNLVSSLLVWHPEGVTFNMKPMSIAEWICDIISTVWFFGGFVMMFFDIHRDEEEKVKNAIIKAKEELEKDGYSLEIDVKEE